MSGIIFVLGALLVLVWVSVYLMATRGFHSTEDFGIKLASFITIGVELIIIIVCL